MTEASVREAGIQAPLMIMRGDGGVMDIREMRRRPVMTMLSGPAASVAGALMYLRVSDGIYFEVGGTSTNIGVIRNGRPTVKYARVGGHETYVSSLDVRVIGIAGGSMVRARDGKLVDVGPRSAHIAGLPYAAFAKLEDIVEPAIEFFQPKADDPGDYVAVRSANGTRYAITNTCAANVLGYARPGLHAYGNPESAQLAIAALAEFIGKTIEDTARAILDIATDKVIPVVDDLIREYKLDRDQAVLVGEGGGAAALIPHASSRTGLRHEISKDAEVISSIGVALALVRDVVERVIPNPQPEDLKRIRREAFEAAVKLGAAPDNVEVTIEVDQNTHRVRATAMGASEMRARQRRDEISEIEAGEIAAKSMGVSLERVTLAASTPRMRVFQGEVEERSWGIFKKRRSPVRAVDLDGVIRVQRSHSVVRPVSALTALDGLRRLWEDTTIYNGDSTITPDIFVIVGGQLIDLSGVNSIDQALAVTRSELDGLTENASIALIGIPPSRGLYMTFAAADAPWFAEMVAASPETLGLAMLQADPHGWRLDRAAQFAAVSDALADGAATARDLRNLFPVLTPQEIARELRIPIETTDDDPMVGSIWRFAEYRPRPPHIMLYNRGIAPLERTLVSSERLLGRATPRDVFVAHELYHHAEAVRSEVPIARRYQPTLLRIGNWRWRTGVAALAEIAAGAFAQSLLELPCHPCVLNFVVRDTIASGTVLERNST